MKRWIYLFLSLAVCVSALSLGVHAENIEGPMFMYLSIGPSSDDLTIPNDRYIYNRVLGEIGNYSYGKIDGLRINTPGNYYFFFSFDISATDLWNINTSVTNTLLDSSNVSGLENISYDTSKYQIFWSTVKRVRFVDGSLGIHFEMYGVNNSDNQEQIYIDYINDVLFHTESYSSSSGTKYFNNQITNFQVHFQPNIEELQALIDSYYDEWSTTYFPTINTFYEEFHANWQTLVNDIFRLRQLYTTTYNSYYRAVYNSSGIFALQTSNPAAFINHIEGSLNSIVTILAHHETLSNSAQEAGANDAYSDLNDSADFGSLSDFAGAGSAASWSSGSFSNGLSGIWDFFSNNTFYDLDTTDNRHDTNIYHDEYYQNNLNDYFDIVGSDYDGSTSD